MTLHTLGNIFGNVLRRNVAFTMSRKLLYINGREVNWLYVSRGNFWPACVCGKKSLMWFNVFPQTQAVHTFSLLYNTPVKPVELRPVKLQKKLRDSGNQP